MALNLLFVNSSLTDGGSEKAMSLVAQALVSRNHNVTMLLAREKERTYSIDPKIELVQLRYKRSGKIRKILHRVHGIRSLIKDGDYDFVICYMWDLNLTTLLASLGLRSRVVVSERALPGSFTRSWFSRALERVLYRLAYRIIYQTRDAKAFCPPRLRSRSIVVPNMVEPCGQDMFLGERSQTIVSVGRLSAQKNFPLLIQSFAYFLHSNPNWTLEIYGRGALEDKLRSLAAKLGVSDAVVFAGYVDDLASRIRDAGMFVLSSDYEGISNAMSEAMALGLPVICTDCPVGGAALLIEDRVGGILVPVGDRIALTSAMREVATDKVLASKLSAGAQNATAQFTPEEMVRVWEDRVLC